MTTVMPRPFDLIKWGLDSVDRAVKQAEGQTRIPEEAQRAFNDFERSFDPKTNQMREAMAQEIRWMNDGRTFPWSVDPDTKPAKYTDTEKAHLRFASALQSTYRTFAAVLNRADNDRTLSYEESEKLKGLVDALKTGVETLVDGVENMREAKSNARPAYEIFNSIKNQVNETSNDTRFGPFGMLVKFGEQEADSFLTVLNYTVTDWAKKQEVIEMLYDTAASPYGNLVLDRAAVAKLQESWGHLDVDWSKAIDAYKDEHPIVALYAVAIDSEIGNNNNVRELEAMLRAGEAAHSELSVSFVRNGPEPVGGAELSASALAFSEASPRDRAVQVENLGEALKRLRARIAELKAQG